MEYFEILKTRYYVINEFINKTKFEIETKQLGSVEYEELCEDLEQLYELRNILLLEMSKTNEKMMMEHNKTNL